MHYQWGVLTLHRHQEADNPSSKSTTQRSPEMTPPTGWASLMFMRQSNQKQPNPLFSQGHTDHFCRIEPIFGHREAARKLRKLTSCQAFFLSTMLGG